MSKALTVINPASGRRESWKSRSVESFQYLHSLPSMLWKPMICIAVASGSKNPGQCRASPLGRLPLGNLLALLLLAFLYSPACAGVDGDASTTSTPAVKVAKGITKADAQLLLEKDVTKSLSTRVLQMTDCFKEPSKEKLAALARAVGNEFDACDTLRNQFPKSAKLKDKGGVCIVSETDKLNRLEVIDKWAASCKTKNQAATAAAAVATQMAAKAEKVKAEAQAKATEDAKKVELVANQAKRQAELTGLLQRYDDPAIQILYSCETPGPSKYWDQGLVAKLAALKSNPNILSEEILAEYINSVKENENRLSRCFVDYQSAVDTVAGKIRTLSADIFTCKDNDFLKAHAFKLEELRQYILQLDNRQANAHLSLAPSRLQDGNALLGYQWGNCANQADSPSRWLKIGTVVLTLVIVLALVYVGVRWTKRHCNSICADDTSSLKNPPEPALGSNPGCAHADSNIAPEASAGNEARLTSNHTSEIADRNSKEIKDQERNLVHDILNTLFKEVDENEQSLTKFINTQYLMSEIGSKSLGSLRYGVPMCSTELKADLICISLYADNWSATYIYLQPGLQLRENYLRYFDYFPKSKRLSDGLIVNALYAGSITYKSDDGKSIVTKKGTLQVREDNKVTEYSSERNHPISSNSQPNLKLTEGVTQPTATKAPATAPMMELLLDEAALSRVSQRLIALLTQGTTKGQDVEQAIQDEFPNLSAQAFTSAWSPRPTRSDWAYLVVHASAADVAGANAAMWIRPDIMVVSEMSKWMEGLDNCDSQSATIASTQVWAWLRAEPAQEGRRLLIRKGRAGWK